MSVAVNGVEIPQAAIEREAAHHGEEPAPLEAAARALVVRELLLQEARRLGIEAREEDARIESLLEREVRVPKAGEEECATWYRHNRARMRSPDLVEASHILLHELAEAKAVLAQALSQPGRFAELAHRHSRCPSGAHGGNLGQIRRGETVPEFEAALFSLAPGRVRGELLETRFGLHVLRVERRIDGEPLPFEAVKDRIGAFLDERVRLRATQQYLKILVGRAEIRGVALQGARGLLVQ